MSENIGKKAEAKIKEWLDRPEDGISLDRIYDQMTGYILTSRNICDFVCYKYPNIYYIESKATSHDRFDFTMIADHQRNGLLKKSEIYGCNGWIIILFASYQRAFILDIRDIMYLIENGKKSINITKLDDSVIPYAEIKTIPSRKQLLDYTGTIAPYYEILKDKRKEFYENEDRRKQNSFPKL